VVAVEAQFSADDDADVLREVARQLANDLAHQFGIRVSALLR
jgi:hypothetical protein